MPKKNLPLNPWLAEIVRQSHESRSESYLRNWYRMSLDMGEGLSWQDFLTRRFLEGYLYRNPLLQEPLSRMPLSCETRDGLYWTGVDRLSDLLQITRKELDAICLNEDLDKGEIIRYLDGLGKELKSFPGRTLKLSLSYGYWTVPSPGASHHFNISRPTLRDEWFDEYYRRYGCFEGEKEHQQALESVRPFSLEDKALPDDYRQFFQAAENLFNSYAACCSHCQIVPMVLRPVIPSLDVRFIYREGLRAVIDIFERTSLLKNVSVEDYLTTLSDEKRLNFTEKEGHDDNFQLLLISHVELKIDIQIIALTLQERLRGEHKDEYTVEAAPMDPKFAKMVLRLREVVPDEALRERYRRAVEENPDLGWEEFLVQAALAKP